MASMCRAVRLVITVAALLVPLLFTLVVLFAHSCSDPSLYSSCTCALIPLDWWIPSLYAPSKEESASSHHEWLLLLPPRRPLRENYNDDVVYVLRTVWYTT